MKQIKIIDKGGKQIGIRLPIDIYENIENLSKLHKCSIQQIIIYILNEELPNYQ